VSDGHFEESAQFFQSMQSKLQLTSDPAPSHGETSAVLGLKTGFKFLSKVS
jgi:hypothetical protein